MWPDWLTFRPIVAWPGDLTPEWLRKSSPFDAPLSRTTALLERELNHLHARNPVLQVALSERDIRLDGKPRSNARVEHPGVILGYGRRGRSRRFGNVAQARAFLAETADLVRSAPDELLYRLAAKRAHPDAPGGSHEKFLKVQEAHRLLGAEDTYQFAVDTFPTWQDNLRAIALGLEALRKVARYGVVKDDEQYAGWKQLTSGGAS